MTDTTAAAQQPAIKKPVASRTQRIAKCALLVALLIVSCFFTIAIGPVPFTLQTAVVILIALLCGPGEAALAVGVYLLMGAIGLPVFSGMTGGIIRTSTGFLFGFLVGSVAASALRIALAKVKAPAIAADVVAAIAYMVIADAMGLVWYVYFGGVTPVEAFGIMVAPFIGVDCVKAVLAIIVAMAVRKAMRWA